MAFDVRAKYRKNHDIASSDNPMLGDMGFSLEKDAERTQYEERKKQQLEKNARLRAIELAKSKASSNAALETNSLSDVNAGDNRTTAYNKPQSISVYGGYGTLPNPATQGMNTAANGAKIDYSAVSQKAKEADTQNKGWKGLNFGKGTENISTEDSVKNATKALSGYDSNQLDLLEQYVKASDNDEASIFMAALTKDYSNLSTAEQSRKDQARIKEEFMKNSGVSEEEFNNLVQYASYMSHYNAEQSLKEQIQNSSGVTKAALSVADVATFPAQSMMDLGDRIVHDKPTAPGIGRDNHNFYTALHDISQDTEESVLNEADTIENPFLREAAKFGYQTTMAAGKSYTAAMTGDVGLLFFGSSAYTDAARDAEERGLDDTQVQLYAITAGLTEMATEKIPQDHLRSLIFGGEASEAASKGFKETLKQIAIQMFEEGNEEGINDVVNTITDSLIAGDKSQLNIDYQNYIANGMTEDQALKQVIWDKAKEIGYDYAVGAVSGGMSAGAAVGINAGLDTATGRDIAKNQELNKTMVRDENSPNYISQSREDYNTDEAFNNAVSTHQNILNASEQAAKGNRVSGRDARAITRGVRQAYSDMDARSKVVFEARQNAARQEAQMQAIDKIQNAKTASEVESIKEKYANNDAVVAAVEEKKAQMVQSGEATQADFDNAITPTKAHDIAKSGKEIAKEELEKLPEEVQNAYHVGYSEKAHEVTSNIQNTDVTNILYREKGKSKVEQIKSVSADKNEIVFETESGTKVPASEVEFNERAKYLYNGENGILSLNEPALVQLAIDTEAESQHGISVANVTTPIKTMYTSGQTGISFEEALKGLGVYSKAVSEEVLRKAYEEGTKTNTATARATTNVKKGRGLIVESAGNEDAYNSQFIDSKGNISEEVRDKFENEVTDTEKKFLELFSKKIGVDIKFTSDNSGNRGEYKPSEGAIYLNLNNGKNMFEVALHEGIGEFLAASNEKAYNQIADSVLNAYAAMNSNKLASDIRAYQKAYSEDKYGDTARGASRELFNDAIGEILSSESNLKKMFDWMITNEGEAQAQKVKKTLVDYFHDIVDMIKSIKKLGGLSRLERNNMRLSEEQANKYADMIFKAMDEAIANANSATATSSRAENNRKSISVDTNGRSLSEGQQEYFADSKIRDEQDRLLVVYHGTPYGGFTVFKNDLNYYTTNKEYAERYQDPSASSNPRRKDAATQATTYEGYLNITKPFDISDPETREIFINEYVKGGYALGINPYISDAEIEKQIENGIDWNEAENLLEFIQDNEYDYDGLILDEGGNFDENGDVNYRGKSYVTFNSNQFKNVDNLNPTDNEDIRFSLKVPVEETRDLIAMHNISEDKLLKTLEIGGFPMPSIGITKANQGYEGFGDISVIFSKDTIDPANPANRVYSGDAWTPTFPSIEYKVNEDALQDLAKRVGQSYSYLEANIFDGSSNTEDKLKRAKYIREAFLNENNIEKQPKHRGYEEVKPHPRYFAHTPSAEVYILVNDVTYDKLISTPGMETEIANEIRKDAEKRNQHTKLVLEAKARNFERAVQEIRDKSIDYEDNEAQIKTDLAIIRNEETETYKKDLGYTDGINEAIEAHQAEYDKYIDDIMKSVVGKYGVVNNKDPYDRLGNRRSFEYTHYEYNLEGLLKAMLEEDEQGAGTFMAGWGNVTGLATERLDSIDAIKAERERIQNLSEEEIKSIKQNLLDRFTEIISALNTNPDDFFASDNIATSIGEALRESKTRTGFKNALLKYNVKKEAVTDALISDVFDLLHDIRIMPTQYLEAKPRRGVGLDEIVGVVLPSDMQNVKDALTQNNISYAEYERENNDSRVKALNTFENARFSKKVDTEGRTISPAMQQFLSDNASVFYEDGAVKNYYHGTRYAGFTQFDLNRMDDKQSIFLTDSKKVAKTYSGTFEMFEPDREWSFDELDSALSYMTGGDWELEEIDNGYQITKYGDEAGQETVETYESLKQVQEDFIDNYLNKVDLQSGESGGIYNVYVHSTNPLVIDAENNSWDQLAPKEYDKHFTDVNINQYDDVYDVDYADVKGNYAHETFNSKEEFEKKFAKLLEEIPEEGLYYEDLYLDKDNNALPTNTRAMSAYAKEHGYDSLVINNLVDTGLFGSASERMQPAQIVVVFDSNQVKSVYNENPTSDADIRKSIKVDWDSHDNYEVPARTYDELVGFNGTDEEIEAAEQQDLAVKAYYANIIHSKNFAGLMFEFKDGNRTKQNFLTRSTRKGYDWQYSYGFNNEPHGHNNYKDVNDVVEVYGNVWGDDMTALYQELLDATPREGVKVQVVREGIAEEGRHSVEVFGESSPYADTLKQTEYVSQVLSTLNNQMKGSSVSLKYIDDTVKYIMDKYQANLNPEELTQELVQFIGYMTANEKVDYNQMMNYLMNVGDKVIQASELKDPESERIYGELKKELSSHKIALSEKERKELISKFGGEWKTVFGKLNSIGIKLDSKNGQRMDAGIYEDIAKQFREIAGVYLDESTTPVDQIATIIDAMDAVQPTAYEWEGANQMDKALDVATTIIDRYYSMASSIKESNIVRGTEKGNAAVERAKQAEIKRLRAKQAEWKEKLNEDFAALVEDKKKMVAEQQEFYRKQAEIERKFKGEQRKFNQKMNMSEKELEKTAKVLAKIEYQGIKDTEAKRKNKDNILRTCTRLINWMEKPTDARHVPTFLKPALSDMIKAIDFMPASMRKGNDGTISAQKWQTSMRKLQQVLSTINSQTMESMDDSDKYNLALVLDAEDIVVKMEELLNKYSGTADISRMSKEDLKTLSDIMTNISKGISQMNENFMNRRFKHVSDAAVAAMEEMDKLKPLKDTQNYFASTAGDFLNIDMLEPISFMEELGEASSSIMQEFFDGEKIGIQIIQEADKFFDNLGKEFGLKTKDTRKWREDARDFSLDGGKITLTTADIMSLYCSYKRESLDQQERPFEATHHIMSGGIKGYRHRVGFKEINKTPRALHGTEAKIMEIINTLTPEQMAYADAVVDYMSTTLAEHGNETSNKLNGYSKFLGKYYFPIKTDSNTLATTESNNMSDNVSFRRLINQSFTKSQLDKADNALVVRDFFSVVTEHITGMSNYCAYAMPLSDALRWYNYSETERNNTDEEDHYFRDTRTLKDSMERVKGSGAKEYFENFIRDVNLDNKPQGSKASKLISQGLTGLAKAKAVGLNIRVILQQPTAIIRATDVIEGKYLAQGWNRMITNPKKAMDYAQGKNYLCYWKSNGFSDTRVSKGMEEIITGQESVRQDIVEKTGILAGVADDITWAAMYYAAEDKVKAETNLQYGTEEFDVAVEEIFSDIINHTQVIDSNLRKTATMRSQDAIEKLANAFKKEPQKTYNMLHRAKYQVIQAEYTGDKAQIKEANDKWHKTFIVFMATSFVTALAQSLVDAWRDDDEEKFWIKFLKKMIPYESYQAIMDFGKDEDKTLKDVWTLMQSVWGGAGNVLDNADILSSIPYVADFDSLLKGYSVTRLDSTSILTQLNNTINTIGSDSATSYKMIYSISELLGYSTGIGVGNALKDIRGIYNQFVAPNTGYYIEKSTTDAKKREKTKAQKYFHEAFQNNDIGAMNNTYKDAIAAGKTESDAWSDVRDALEAEFTSQVQEKNADVNAISNHFTSLLKKTKYENGTRFMSDKEVSNKIESWKKNAGIE